VFCVHSVLFLCLHVLVMVIFLVFFRLSKLCRHRGRISTSTTVGLALRWVVERCPGISFSMRRSAPITSICAARVEQELLRGR
jgi:hypothetical protein